MKIFASAVVALSALAAEANAMKTVNEASSSGIISLPLIPHHAQQRRRKLSESDVLRMEEDAVVRPKRKYHRNLLDKNDKALGLQGQTMGGLYQGYGTHYVDVWVGTPPQRQTVIVDTGSTITSFPCKDCEDCGFPEYHIGPYFDETLSDTFYKYTCDECTRWSDCDQKTDTCLIEQYYSEGSSWNAFEVSDTSYIGGYHNSAILENKKGGDDVDPGIAAKFSFETHFACQTTVEGLFKTQLADGIMGMSDGKQAYWHQMFRAHAIREKKFALCYSRPLHALKEGTEAGAITMGGTDIRLHDLSPMVYTTTVGTSTENTEGPKGHTGYYDIHVRELYWREGSGGESAKSIDDGARVLKLTGGGAINDEGGVIVDSGTTDSYFSSVIQKELRTKWEHLTGLTFGHDKMDISEMELKELPTLLIQLAGDETLNRLVAERDGNDDPNNIPGLAGDLDPDHPYDVIVAVPPTHYFEVLTSGKYMNRIYDTEDDGSVLGANIMMGHDVMFDSNNMRIGWAESSCDYTGLVASEGFPLPKSDGVYESQAEIKKEDQEEEVQEEKKEEYDEENTEAEIEEDNENVEEFLAEGGELPENFNDSYTLVISTGGIDPAIIAAVLVSLSCICVATMLRCCCKSSKRSRRKRRKYKQIEMRKQRRGYKDEYRDEITSESDSDYSESDSEAEDLVPTLSKDV